MKEGKSDKLRANQRQKGSEKEESWGGGAANFKDDLKHLEMTICEFTDLDIDLFHAKDLDFADTLQNIDSKLEIKGNRCLCCL